MQIRKQPISRLPSDYIIAGAQQTYTDLKVLQPEEAAAIRSRVVSEFTQQQRGVIWQDLKGQISIQNSNAWLLIDDILAGNAFILFFDEAEDRTMISFSASSKLTPVVEECPGFEFYVTNSEVTYILCFNHHDFLIGAGDAAHSHLFA